MAKPSQAKVTCDVIGCVPRSKREMGGLCMQLTEEIITFYSFID